MTDTVPPMRFRFLPLAVTLALAPIACQLISGVSDYETGTTPPSGGNGGSPSATGGAGGAGGRGGAGGGGAPPAQCEDELAAANAGDVAWSRAFGDGRTDAIYDIVSAPGGGVFIVGQFGGQLFSGTDYMLDAGTTDLSGFAAHLDPCGDVVWAKELGGAGSQAALAAAISGDRLFVTGAHAATFSIDGIVVSHAAPTVGGPTLDAWLAALAIEDGEAIWANAYGGPNDDYPTGIATDGQKIVVSGTYGNGAVFNVTPIVVPDNDAAEGFVLAVDGAFGAYASLATVAGPGNDFVTNVALHSSGDVFALTVFSDTITSPTNATAEGNYPDMAIIRFDQALDYEDMRAFTSGTPDAVAPLDIAVEGDTLAVAGLYTGTLDLGGATLAAEGTGDGFVGLFDIGLTSHWARSVGGGGDSMSPLELLAWLFGTGELKLDGLGDVVFDPNGGRLYVSGSCRGDFEIEPGVFESCPDQDVVVMALDASNGNTVWSDAALGAGHDGPWGLAIAGPHLVVGGTYRGRIKFQNETQLPDSGDTDNAFVARYGR